MKFQQPIENVSRAERVYQVLREQVLRGNLAPGEKLDIFGLSKSLGVSRTPVKEAFNRLALEGLVEIHPQSGTFVTKVTEEDVDAVFDLRLMMELWGLEHAFREPKSLDLDTMGSQVEVCRDLLKSSGDFDYYQFTEHDLVFHLSIIRASGNPRLIQHYQALNSHIQLMRVYWGHAHARALQSQAEHERIFESFRAGKPKECREALTSHILSSREDMMRFLQQALRVDEGEDVGP